MFLGLKSPRTSVRSSAGRSMAAIKRIDARRQVRMGTGGRPVVGVDPQLVEQARVGQGSAQGGMPRASAWIVPRIVPSRAAMSGSTWPAINCVFQVTASSGAQVIANR